MMKGKMPAKGANIPMHEMASGAMMPGKKHMMPDMPPKGMGMPPKKMAKGKKGK